MSPTTNPSRLPTSPPSSSPPSSSNGSNPPPSSDHIPPAETFLQRLTRRTIEEPLIPLGLGLTIAAFMGAARAIRAHDHARANIMFRRRIAAQAFTVAAMIGGSWWLKDERARQKEVERIRKEREGAERREAWLKELEIREVEDREAREKVDELRERQRRRREEERRRGQNSDDVD